MTRLLPRGVALVLGGAIILAACGDSDPIKPPTSPLIGLVKQLPTDSAGNQPPAGTGGSGVVSGTVLGPSAPGAGNDSLETAPRVSGAVITAYPVVAMNGAEPQLGDPIASTQSGGDGKFTLPSLEAGDYVVTVLPPAGSGYSGVWLIGKIHSGSGDYPWWVVLHKP